MNCLTTIDVWRWSSQFQLKYAEDFITNEVMQMHAMRRNQVEQVWNWNEIWIEVKVIEVIFETVSYWLRVGAILSLADISAELNQDFWSIAFI